MRNTRARAASDEPAHPQSQEAIDRHRRFVRGAVRNAARRGAGEAVFPVSGMPGDVDAIRRALGSRRYGVASVNSEDGPYAVVYW